ncbi:hypothetical protein [Myxococcus landrumensis]|uniref:Uncharacterized protein n=1 Tax=Myxococcus landrumensis TaxID=2813577 RepID=A0ABX7N1H6_9BACT|nr:hypothetical protein [Myxococcus landrumus]QSQ12351.1 hypothetical protein JY572_28865 [Myxococcus landrumus]
MSHAIPGEAPATSAPARSWSDELLASLHVDRFELCATMSLLLLMLYSSGALRVRIPLTLVAVLGLLLPRLKREPMLWFIAFVITLVGTFQERFEADNHKYLLSYWCLALFCAACAREPERVLAVSARALVGGCFAFAVFWKLISEDYLDGSFFRYALLQDPRFQTVGQGVGQVTDAMAELNTAALHALTNYDSTLGSVQLVSTPAVDGLATLMTRWTLGIELAVSLAFLVPMRGAVARSRDVLLLVFVLSTYALAPVLGFGWVLLIMGLAQCEEDSRLFPVLYLLAFVCLQVYRFPWGSLLQGGGLA